MPFRSGANKPKRAELRRLGSGQDATGAENGTWDLLATRWMSIEPLEGRELFAAQQINAEITHRVRCRYDSAIADLRPKDRIYYGLRIFDILSAANEEERNREFLLLCKERV